MRSILKRLARTRLDRRSRIDSASAKETIGLQRGHWWNANATLS
jgi:hypothetical protein